MELLEEEVKHKEVETQRMQKEEVLSLEKEEHLNKDACLRVLLRANLMNSLHDTSLKRKLLTDCAGDDSGDPNELPKTVQRFLWDMGHTILDCCGL